MNSWSISYALFNTLLKLLFLLHKNSRVSDKLLKKLEPLQDTAQESLGWAKYAKYTVQTKLKQKLM